MNSSCGVRSKFTNSRKSARFSDRSAAAARRRVKSSHSLLLWLPGSPYTQWTKLRGRRCLSTRERTSFVAVPQTENGRVLSWRADNLPSFAFCHVSQTFEELFQPRFSRLDAQWIELCIDVFIVVIGRMVAEILSFQSETIAKSWCVPIV